MKWTDIEDEKPKDDTIVLGFHEAGFICMVHHLKNGEFKNKPNLMLNEYEITHWMDLPAPPNQLAIFDEEQKAIV